MRLDHEDEGLGPLEGRCSHGRVLSREGSGLFLLKKKTLEALQNSHLSLSAIWVKDVRGQSKRVIHKA